MQQVGSYHFNPTCGACFSSAVAPLARHEPRDMWLRVRGDEAQGVFAGTD